MAHSMGIDDFSQELENISEYMAANETATQADSLLDFEKNMGAQDDTSFMPAQF